MGSMGIHERVSLVTPKHVARTSSTILASDPPASTLLRTLLTAASAPYAQILRTWTHHGALRDPHGEFFVRARVGAGELDSRGKTKEDYTDEYWERRYTVRIRCRLVIIALNYPCISYETDQRLVVRRRDIKPAYLFRGHLVDAYPVAHVYRLFLSGGSTRCCLRASISMSYRNVASRLAKIHNQPMRNCR